MGNAEAGRACLNGPFHDSGKAAEKLVIGYPIAQSQKNESTGTSRATKSPLPISQRALVACCVRDLEGSWRAQLIGPRSECEVIAGTVTVRRGWGFFAGVLFNRAARDPVEFGFAQERREGVAAIDSFCTIHHRSILSSIE